MTANLRIEATVQVDASQATAGLAAVTASAAGVTAGMRGTAAAAAEASAGLDRATAAGRATATATAAVAAQGQATAAALTAQRTATAETAAAQDQLTASERAGVAAANALASAHRATNEGMLSLRTNNLELLHIGKSLFDEIAAGASPFRALAVEGGRIGEVIAGSGGVSKAFGGLISLLGGPLVVGALAAAGAAALIGFKFSDAQSAAVKLQRQLDVTGNQAGLTAADVAAMGEKVAAATNTSTSAATDAVTKLATTGKFTRAEVEQLGAAAIGLAARTGETADKVVGAFVKMADGPDRLCPPVRRVVRRAERRDGRAHPPARGDGAEGPGDRRPVEGAVRPARHRGPGQARLPRARVGGGDRRDRGRDARRARLRPDRHQPGRGGKQARRRHPEQIDAIRNSSSYQRNGGDYRPALSASDVARGYTAGPTDNERIAALERQLAIAKALGDETVRSTHAVATYNATQRAGTAAAAEIASQWGSIGDHVRKANDEIAKFKADVAAALKANPNDPTALEAQANSAKIEADIRKKYTPDATAAARAAAEEEKARAKKLADLEATIVLIEGEAAAAGQVKEVSEEDNKVLELRKQYGSLFTAELEKQVRLALQLKTSNSDFAKLLLANSKFLDDAGHVDLLTEDATRNAASASRRRQESSDPIRLATRSMRSTSSASRRSRPSSSRTTATRWGRASLRRSSRPPARSAR